jgi:hypothetical protein
MVYKKISNITHIICQGQLYHLILPLKTWCTVYFQRKNHNYTTIINNNLFIDTQ